MLLLLLHLKENTMFYDICLIDFQDVLSHYQLNIKNYKWNFNKGILSHFISGYLIKCCAKELHMILPNF